MPQRVLNANRFEGATAPPNDMEPGRSLSWYANQAYPVDGPDKDSANATANQRLSDPHWAFSVYTCAEVDSLNAELHEYVNALRPVIADSAQQLREEFGKAIDGLVNRILTDQLAQSLEDRVVAKIKLRLDAIEQRIAALEHPR